ncbi:MAG: ATP-binding cassette domain-containing protein [Turneriella sp.]|nr:ATP-binding cassette domain-containing protein [Leptospiraceae bacterium]MCX7633148.1 ATP-binding cassette domain-containing protein [Turneriella sp.]
MAAIRTEGLTLILGGKTILDSITFSVAAGETLVLMGKNGCGKTMLLKTLVGLFTPQQGFAEILGQNVHRLSPIALDQLRRKIGYVFQKSGLFDSLPVWENVVFALRRFSDMDHHALRHRATECLNRTGLKDVEDKFPSELSGGMQKRAGIARAIAMSPEILLFDDPTAGLDPVLTDAIAELIKEITRTLGSTAIVVAHDFNLAYKLADKIGLMVAGRLHTVLTKDEFRTTDDPYVVQFRESKLTGPIPVIE